MKKIWLFVLSLFSIVFTCNFTQAKDYEYTNLDITANILNDGTIDVAENLTANFFVNKHWIIRDIPLDYSVDWNGFHVEVSDITVEWKSYSTSEYDWNIEIKIWDADRTVIWKQDYSISYSTYGLIRNFYWMWYAELYWNLVGYNFDTNINKVRAELILPRIYTWFTADDFLITTDWKSKTIDWFEWTIDWSSWDRVIITYDKWLWAYHWITLAIKFPNDYFEFDHDRQASLIGNLDNDIDINNLSELCKIIIIPLVILILPVILLVLSVIFIIKVNNNRQTSIKKEFKDKYPVIVQYNPPKWLNSAEVWILFHRYIDPKDTFSLVYKWACEWVIKIQSWRWHSDISLIKTKNISSNCPEYEKNLFNKLFSKNKLILNNRTYLYNKLKNSWLNDYWIEQWRFTKKETKWCSYVWCLMFLICISICLIFPLSIFIIFVVIAAIWQWNWGLQQKNLDETEKWAKLISHILWYRQFLKTCDENKLKLFLQQDPLYFDKILPYAVVFGLDTKLIKKITPLMQEMNINPTWYEWNLNSLYKVAHTINSMAYSQRQTHNSWHSSYSYSGWFSSWSSFSWWWNSFSSWWGGGWWGWRSW